MTYSERNRRRSFRYPKSVAGTMPNRYRTVIIVLARYYDVVLSHTEQKGEDDLVNCVYMHLAVLSGAFVFL